MGFPRKPDVIGCYSVKRNFRTEFVVTPPPVDFFYSDSSSVWPMLRMAAFALQSRSAATALAGDRGAIVWTQDFFTAMAHSIGRSRPQDLLAFECHGVSDKMFRLFSPAIRRIRRVVATTSGIRNAFLRIGYPDDRILVLPNAVVMEDFDIPESREECRRRLGLPEGRKIIGYIGMFVTYGIEKGIPTLIRSLARLQSRFDPPPMLVCVGGPLSLADEYHRIADSAGVPRDSLRIVDFQPRSEVARWIKACDVCTIPSPRKKVFIEHASPMKLFEYMAAGVPVAASDLPVLRDVLRDGRNGLLIPPEDPQAWAEGIGRILENPRLAEELVREGRETVRNNSWERRAARAHSFFAD
jgi:glycosyltransferase involved in cell wall biosynthesis